MTDRELLERAAKAHWGDEIDDVCSVRWLETDNAIGYTHGDNQDHNGQDRERVWNPLEDDGDALRLAVKLGLQIRHYPIFEPEKFAVLVVRRAWNADAERDISRDEMLHYLGDPYAATRRAIVRAAAAMGEP